MSHVDDGTLHAYLDGELSALEAVRVEAHANECDACRARLADERGLIARATELLAAAVPPERLAPPWRRPGSPRRWDARWQLAAAASVVLALAIGWGIGTRPRFQFADPPTPAAGVATAPPAVEQRDAAAPADTAPPVRTPEQPPAAPAERAPDSSRPAGLATADDDPVPAAEDGANRAAAATPRAVPVPEEPRLRAEADAAPALARAAPEALSVAAGSALLGAELLGVPGLLVRGVRLARQPGYGTVVLVEQALDSSRTIQVVHRRVAAGRAAPSRAAEGAAPEPARTDSPAGYAATRPGDLEIEVTGALPADSLQALRQALRPLP